MISSISTPAKKSFPLILVLLTFLFLSACNRETPPQEEILPPPTPITLWNPQDRPSLFLKEVGTVKPFQEVEVVANVGGIVDELTIQVGDTVETDQVLGQLRSSGANPALINLSNARNQLKNAQHHYDESVANNDNLARQAKLRAENLELNLQRLQGHLREGESGNIHTEASLELQKSSAQKNVDQLEVSLKGLENQFERSRMDFYSTSQLTLDGLLLNAQIHHQEVSDILNPDRKNRINTQDVPTFLGSGHVFHRHETLALYNALSQRLEDTQNAFKALLPLSSTNFDEALFLFTHLTQESRKLMEAMRILLQHSNVSDNLPSERLEAYQAQIAVAENAALNDLITINSLKSTAQDLKIQENTQTTSAQNHLLIGQNQHGESLNALNQFRHTGEVPLKDLELQVSSVKKDLKSAYIDYENLLRNNQIQKSTKQLDIQTYQNQVQLAQNTLKDHLLRSPLQGVVVDIYAEEGNHVNSGSPVIKIHQQNQMKVVFYVTQEQVQNLRKGQEVTVILNDGTQSRISGRLIHIAPGADAQNRKIKVEAAFTGPQLRPETFVTVEIEVSDTAFKPGALYVPLNAVIFNQNSQSLFVVESKIQEGLLAKEKTVSTGKILDQWVEILAGLEVEDQVVFKGSRGLEEGDRLSILQSNEHLNPF